MMITRTLTTYEAVAIKLEYKQGQAVATEIARVQYEGTSASKAAARKAFAANGIAIPRGCEFEINEKIKRTYGVSVEEFMAHAQLINEQAVAE